MPLTHGPEGKCALNRAYPRLGQTHQGFRSQGRGDDLIPKGGHGLGPVGGFLYLPKAAAVGNGFVLWQRNYVGEAVYIVNPGQLLAALPGSGHPPGNR